MENFHPQPKPVTLPLIGSIAMTTALCTLMLLKGLHVISWSWWAVTSPVWIVPAIVLVSGIVALSRSFYQGFKGEIQNRKTVHV